MVDHLKYITLFCIPSHFQVLWAVFKCIRNVASQYSGWIELLKPIKSANAVLVLALGGVGSLPRASQFRGPHSSKKRALQAVDC